MYSGYILFSLFAHRVYKAFWFLSCMAGMFYWASWGDYWDATQFCFTLFLQLFQLGVVFISSSGLFVQYNGTVCADFKSLFQHAKLLFIALSVF